MVKPFAEDKEDDKTMDTADIVLDVKATALDVLSKTGTDISDGTFNLALLILETIHNWKKHPEYRITKLREILDKASIEYSWTVFDCNPEFVEFKNKLKELLKSEVKTNKDETGKVKRNFENYANRHEAFLVYQELHDSRKCPYWFKDEHQKSAFVVDFDEWIWLPVNDNPACPIAWKKEYLGQDEGGLI